MSAVPFASLSVAMTTATDAALRRHLARPDGQEDVCFALWRQSVGHARTTVLVSDVVLPEAGDRHRHGNAAFESRYFLRAAQVAAEAEAGLALLHSHPSARGWQGLSADDANAERSHAPRASALTGHSLVGLTLGTGDFTWSARRWDGPPGAERPAWADTVRVVGDQFRISFNPTALPVPALPPTLTRTTSAWGEEVQAMLGRLRIGVVGVGSVGAIVAEALARMGIGQVVMFDFDRVEDVNLDRLLHAGAQDGRLRRAKVEVAVRALRRNRANPSTKVNAYELSVVEPEGLAAALDCDVLFSCVDRPWPRHVLNLAAYAHLIPVVDGGISVDAGGGAMRGAEWRAHVAAPGRRCLTCLGQADPGLVAVEREGLLDDPAYVQNLPPAHPVRQRENVFGFSLAAASAEILQFVSMVAAPAGTADVGAQLFHLTTGTVDRDERGCEPGCLYTDRLVALGDHADLVVTGRHPAAEQAREGHRAKRWSDRLVRLLEDLAERLA
jgi:hypothetical protein